MKNTWEIRPIITIFLASLAIILFINSVEAADVTLVKEYTYQASEADSKLSSRAIALEQIKRLLLEELGTFLISETEVKDFQLTKDQIVTYTAGSVITVILEEKWDGQKYYMKAKLTANPVEVTKSIADLRQDREKSHELEELRKKSDEALHEIEKLKEELARSKNSKPSKLAYETAVNQLQIKELIDKGIVLRKTKLYDDALEIFTQAITLQPKEARAYSGRGAVYGEQKKLERALSDFNKAIELDPQYAPAYNNRGVVFREQKDVGRAMADFTKAIGLDPKFALAFNNRGLAYIQQKEVDLAVADYTMAIELDPKYARSYYNRGNAYIQQKEIDRAIADYSKAIEIDPKYAPAYNNRGNAYRQQKEVGRAIADFTKAIELDPKSALPYNNRGNVYRQQKEVDRAIADFTKAIELDPKYALAYYNRGNAYTQIKEANRAIEDYKEAAKLGHKGAQDLLRKKEEAQESQSQPGPAKKRGVGMPIRSGRGSETPKSGMVETPKFGEVAVHQYGLVPLPSDDASGSKSPGTVVPKSGTPSSSASNPATAEQAKSAVPATQAKKADFTGRYFGSEGATLHTWDFYADGTFLHTRIAAGAGTSVRNSERGAFRLDGEYVELKIGKTTTGFATPAVGGRDALVGGGTEAKAEVRRLKIQFLEDGKQEIVLDGKTLKVKTW